jgi:hypothetical protein
LEGKKRSTARMMLEERYAEAEPEALNFQMTQEENNGIELGN